MHQTGTPAESSEYAELRQPSECPQCAREQCGEMRRRARPSFGLSDIQPQRLRYRTSSVNACTARTHSPRDFGLASADVKGRRRGTWQSSTRLPDGAISAGRWPRLCRISVSRSTCRGADVARCVPDHRRAAGSNLGKKVLSSGFMGRKSRIDAGASCEAAPAPSGAVTRDADAPWGDGLFCFTAASAVLLSV